MRYLTCESSKLGDGFTKEEYDRVVERLNEGGSKMNSWLDIIEDEAEARGQAIGEANGRLEGIRVNVSDWLVEEFGPDCNELFERLQTVDDFDVLRNLSRYMRRARPFPSLEELERKLDELLAER